MDLISMKLAELDFRDRGFTTRFDLEVPPIPQTSHHHGSVENGCISNIRFLSFRVVAFHWTMIMGERVICINLPKIGVSKTKQAAAPLRPSSLPRTMIISSGAELMVIGWFGGWWSQDASFKGTRIRILWAEAGPFSEVQYTRPAKKFTADDRNSEVRSYHFFPLMFTYQTGTLYHLLRFFGWFPTFFKPTK